MWIILDDVSKIERIQDMEYDDEEDFKTKNKYNKI